MNTAYVEELNLLSGIRSERPRLQRIKDSEVHHQPWRNLLSPGHLGDPQRQEGSTPVVVKGTRRRQGQEPLICDDRTASPISGRSLGTSLPPLPRPSPPSYPSHRSMKPLPHFPHSWCQKPSHLPGGPSSQKAHSASLPWKTEQPTGGLPASTGAADLLTAGLQSPTTTSLRTPRAQFPLQNGNDHVCAGLGKRKS